MAIIKLGATVIGIRGTIGGITYSANGSGPYCRGWSGALKKRTSLQSIQRAHVAELGQSWRSLTSAQQTAWNALSAAPPEAVTNSLGETIVLSGYQWFCKIVARRFLVASAPSLLAPTTAAPTFNSYYNFNARAAGSIESQFNYGTWTAADFMIFDLTVYPSIGVATPTGNWKQIWADHPTNNGWTYITTPYYAAFGQPIVGQRAFLRCATQSPDGLRSVAVIQSRIVTAS